jgi:murein DD-endopeptidase MepM/ murein hydrolase activator NlpD
VSSRSSRRRTQSRSSSPRHPGHSARHRKPSPLTSALRRKPVRVAAAAAASTLIASSGAAAATHWLGAAARPAALDQAHAASSFGVSTYLDAHPARQAGAGPLAGRGLARSSRRADIGSQRAYHKPAHAAGGAAPQAAAHPVYRNPLRGVSGLIPERVDMGIDFGGSGPVYALGDAVITNATAGSGGWPGGGWITYRLTDGPDAGLVVYVAEDVTPTVQVGQQVSSATVIATMFDGGDGIETGWAMPDGASAESELPAAGGISGNGPFPTRIGLSFADLLQSLGVPAGNNSTQAAYGTLPPDYPGG